MVHPEGFEPPTKWFEATYSIQLSYGCVITRFDIIMLGHKLAWVLPLQILEFVFHAVPLCCIGGGVFLFSDIRPHIGKFGIELEKHFLTCGDLIFGVNSIGRAFWFTESAVDTFIRVNHQEIRALVKAVHRAHFHTVRMLTVDAIFAYNKCHS